MTKEEQAIEYIKKYRELDEKLYNTAPKGTVSSIATQKCLEFWDMAIKALEQEQEPKTGHWIVVPGMNEQCSECGKFFPLIDFKNRPFDINYCPNCGAKMVEPQERSGKE